MMNSGMDDDFPPNPFRNNQGGGDPFQPQMNMQQQPQMNMQQQPQFSQSPQFGGNNNYNPNPPLSGAMDPSTPQSTPISWWGLCMACVRLDTYKRYFDVDTEDVQKRMMAAMTHFHQPQYFREQVVGPEKPQLGIQASAPSDLKGPDLYGPVWITFVLILLVAATANWSKALFSNEFDEFEYDINHLLHAWSFLTTFVFGVPTVFWLCCRCMSLEALTLAEWICYYGYSMVPFLPAAILCIIPISFLEWVFLLAASGASALLILRNASTPLLASDPSHQKAPPLILAILVAHFIFYVSMAITFYHHGKHKHAPSSHSSSHDDDDDSP